MSEADSVHKAGENPDIKQPSLNIGILHSLITTYQKQKRGSYHCDAVNVLVTVTTESYSCREALKLVHKREQPSR